MDPNDCLEEMLRLATRWASWNLEDKSRMAELVEALDGWLSWGGFLPKKWERKPPVIEVEVKTSPLVGYMDEAGQTYCLTHDKGALSPSRVSEAMARNADMSCATCGEELAK